MKQLTSFEDHPDCVHVPSQHFRHFISDFSKNSGSISKRGQEQNFTDESAVTNSISMNSIRWEVGSDSTVVLSK